MHKSNKHSIGGYWVNEGWCWDFVRSYEACVVRELYQVSMINDIQCLQCTKVNTCSQHPHCASVPSPCHQETSLSCYNLISKFIHMWCNEVYIVVSNFIWYSTQELSLKGLTWVRDTNFHISDQRYSAWRLTPHLLLLRLCKFGDHIIGARG